MRAAGWSGEGHLYNAVGSLVCVGYDVAGGESGFFEYLVDLACYVLLEFVEEV